MEDSNLNVMNKAFEASWKNFCIKMPIFNKLNPIFNITKNPIPNISKFGDYSCPAFFDLYISGFSKMIHYSLLSDCLLNFIEELNQYFISINIDMRIYYKMQKKIIGILISKIEEK